MKQLHILLLCCISLTSCALNEAAAEELLKNTGFEEAKDGKPVPWALNEWGGRSSVIVSSNTPYGKQGLQVTLEKDGIFTGYQSAHDLKIPKWTILRLSGFYRTEGLQMEEKGGILVQAKLNLTQEQSQKRYPTAGLEPSPEWRRFEKIFQADVDIKDFQFLITIQNCQGKVWFDDFSLEAVGPGEQLTLFSLKKRAPRIDGELDDPFWQGAQIAKGFMPVGKPEAANPDTEVMTIYDDTRLYFGVKALEPNMDMARGGTSASPWAGNCLEFFICPRGIEQELYHIAVDADGHVAAGIEKAGQRAATDLKVEAAARRHADHWTLELAIPFSEFGAGAPADNARWVFNVARERYLPGKQELFSWALLNEFRERRSYGKLAFYSRHEIIADIAYWKDSDRDPLMGRPVVSGVDIAGQLRGEKRIPDLWTYYPYEANRASLQPGWTWKEAGLMPEMKAREPEFYEAAMAFNRLMIKNAFLKDKLDNARRAEFYVSALQIPREAVSNNLDHFELSGKRIDNELNTAYQQYGQAFGRDFYKDKREVAGLAGLDKRLSDINHDLDRLAEEIEKYIKTLTIETTQKQGKWTNVDLSLPSEEKRLDANGASRRLQFAAHEHYGNTEALKPLGPFGCHTIYTSTPRTGKEPGKYDFTNVDEDIAGQLKQGYFDKFYARAWLCGGAGLSLYMPDWLLEKARTDPDIFMQSQDQKPPSTDRADQFTRGAVNINNPEVREHTRAMMRQMGKCLAAHSNISFLLTAGEGFNRFRVIDGDKKQPFRSMGYNPTGKTAFRKYLQERYGDIGNLNRRWHTDYRSFDAIEPPADKNITPPKEASGLTYEFERWTNVNYIDFLRLIRDSFKEGAPDIPVLPDLSSYLIDGNTYLAYRGGIGDIMSFHTGPGYEEPMWAYMRTMNRVFGKVTGYYENYWGMFRKVTDMNDERLSWRDVSNFFFLLYTHDVRVSAWWLRYRNSETSYCLCYNGDPFGLEYNQTIYRWSTTALPVMFQRGLAMEKTLLDSRPELPETAIIQPCATLYNVASFEAAPYGLVTSANNPVTRMMFDLNNFLLRPDNFPHDYVPEEMALDGLLGLEGYKLLILPYAPYMSKEFSEQLGRWVKRGGTLMAFGPFALFDPYGFALPAKSSVFRKLFPECRKTGAGYWDYSLTGGSEPNAPLVKTVGFGRGQVVYINRSVDTVMRNPSLWDNVKTVLRDKGARTAIAQDPAIRLSLREGKAGERYLWVNNSDTRHPVETTVVVNGKYDQVYDLLIPGWFPVPAKVAGGRTEIHLRLQPGEWTVLRLIH